MRIEGNLNALLGIHRLDQAEVQKLAKSEQSAPAQDSPATTSRDNLRSQIRLFEASARVIQDSATTVKVIDRAMGSIDGLLAEMQDAAKSADSPELSAILSDKMAQVLALETNLDTDGTMLPSLGRPDWNSHNLQDAVQKGDRAEIVKTLSETRDQLMTARSWSGEARNMAIQNGLMFLDEHAAQLGSGEAHDLANFTKVQILRQSGMALIAQAQIPTQQAIVSLT